MSPQASVVAFPKSKRTTGPKKPSFDHALIRKCVTYAQTIAAFHGGWDADPSGNSDFAADKRSLQYERAAEAALTAIARTRAATPEGLQAKARVVPILMKDLGNSVMNEDQMEFLLSFAKEVREFLEPIIHSDRTTQAGEAVQS
jgi:hypothetical protein